MNKAFGGCALRIAVGITMLVLLLAGGAGAVPVEEWNKTYRGTYAHSVQQTADGGYILAGQMYKEYLNYDALLIKTDTNGIEQWNKSFGKTDIDNAYAVQQTGDGGYILAGYTHANDNA